jgi:hypothetical protein
MRTGLTGYWAAAGSAKNAIARARQYRIIVTMGEDYPAADASKMRVPRFTAPICG